MVNDKPKRTLVSRGDLWMSALIGTLLIVVAGVTIQRGEGDTRPMVAYLYPLSSSAAGETTIPNLWIAPVDAPDEARAITESRMGIFDFGVSENGHYIAYSERDEETRYLDIHLVDMRTGETRQITNCGDQMGECYTPVFSPDNSMIAYMNKSFDPTKLDAHGHGNDPRIWLMDLATGITAPISQDVHVMGHTPTWSEDSNTIAFYNPDIHNPSVAVFKFNLHDEEVAPEWYTVPSMYGSTGSLAPDGTQMVYPELVERNGAMLSYLQRVDFTTNPPIMDEFTDADGANNDIAAEWHPSGEFITVERRYTDDRWTTGFQLYNIDVETGDITPLIYDEAYSHHFFEWNNTGDKLVVQRLEMNAPSARPEIWVLDTTTGDLVRVSERAFHPRWVRP